MKKLEKRRQTTFRFSEEQYHWLEEQSQREKESANAILRRLVTDAMHKPPSSRTN